MEKLSYLIDTCVLIDYLRGNPSAYSTLVQDQSVNLSMSTVTFMELMRGARNKNEAAFIQKVFKNTINIIYIDEKISRTAEDLIIAYAKSHNLEIDDALIAATALKTGVELITLNVSDFRFIPDLRLYK